MPSPRRTHDSTSTDTVPSGFGASPANPGAANRQALPSTSVRNIRYMRIIDPPYISATWDMLAKRDNSPPPIKAQPVIEVNQARYASNDVARVRLAGAVAPPPVQGPSAAALGRGHAPPRHGFAHCLDCS